MLELVKLVDMKLDLDKLGLKRMLELAQLPFFFSPVFPPGAPYDGDSST